MNYNTHEFVLIFLPLTLFFFDLCPVRWRIPVLGVASLIFYGVSGLIPLFFMLLSILWGYVTAFWLEKRKTFLRMAVAVSFPLLVIYFFKYFNFTLNTLDASAATRDKFYFILSIVLPAGISFYTFQIIAYSVDVADKKILPERNFIKLCTFFALYPQLIAGPILRYQQLHADLTRLETQREIPCQYAQGLKFLSLGLTAKIFFADFLYATCLDKVRPGVVLAPLDAAYSILAYSFRIYYDFWAYSTIAIGLGMMVSLNIMRNFDEPYLSENPREFWRRWHKSLSYWLRDYVYIKLGGNRSYVRNIIIVFLAAGLWHGAGWNFVVWGAYHACLVLSYHFLKRPWDKMPKTLKISMNFTLVSLGWPLFYLNLGAYGQLMRQLFDFGPTAPLRFRAIHWIFLVLVGAVTFFFREKYWLYNKNHSTVWDSPAVHAILCYLAILFFSFGQTFIYFQF